MIERIQSYLSQPYPFNSNPRNYFKVVLVFTFFVGFFLLFFQPFGINNLPGNEPYWASLGFALVTFVSLMLFLVLTQIFHNYFEEDNWTLGKELFFSLLNFIFVGHANFLFISLAWVNDYNLLNYSSMIIGTFAVGFFPYLFMLLTQHMSKLKRNVARADMINQSIARDTSQVPRSQEIHFTGENESDELVIPLNKLLYIQSSGNYIEVVYNDAQHINKSILRSSLSSAEQLLSDYDNVYRCHRKFLVNLERVKEVHGNSQGYRLSLDRDVDEVPVARTKNVEFRDRMEVLHATKG